MAFNNKQKQYIWQVLAYKIVKKSYYELRQKGSTCENIGFIYLYI